MDLEGDFRMLRLNLFSVVSLSVRQTKNLPAPQLIQMWWGGGGGGEGS